MKTKYELFLEHLIHGIDEPQRTFKNHHKIGFVKDKFALKGKLLSATKIFLSDDFANKQFPEWSRKEVNEVVGKENIRPYHKEIFQNSLPLYDNMLILFPWSFTSGDDVEAEYMAGCWIQKTNSSFALTHEFNGRVSSNIKDLSATYTISTFDNSCKFHGYDERLNLSLVDYLIDFNGGISKRILHRDAKKDLMKEEFGDFAEPVKESYESFIDSTASSMYGKKVDLYKFEEIIENVGTIKSQLGILIYLNLLGFINSKGSETISFKSHLPIKKRSNVLKGFEYKMLEVKKTNSVTTRYGDSINKNRLHDVRGHMRHYQSGKRTWIKSHQRGDEKMGVIIKDYNFK